MEILRIIKQTRKEAPIYTDKITGMISRIGLAESVCDSLNGYDEDGNIPEEFFEVAFLIAFEQGDK